MTETADSQIEKLAALSREQLRVSDFNAARQTLTELAQVLPPSSQARNLLLQALGTLAFHVSGGSTPPPQLIDRLDGVLRQLSAAIPTQPLRPRQTSSRLKRLGPLGAALAFLAKFKTVGLLLLTKGKLLFAGLANIKGLLSILGFLGVYWALYGWWFAIGFFASIFAHEMGHYVTVKRYGYAASAPVFIPFVGAFVAWQGADVTPEVRARIALAGPLFGFLAAILCYLTFLATGGGVWLALAHVGAFLNILNLIPVGIFDGGSAIRAVGVQERVALLIVGLALAVMLRNYVCFFLAMGAAYRLIRRDAPPQGSQSAAYYFLALLIALALFDWHVQGAANSLMQGIPTRTPHWGLG